MTNEEAIKILKNDYSWCPYTCQDPCVGCIRESHSMAIRALEKQIPKKPIFSHEREFAHDKVYKCPACGGMLGTKLINRDSKMIGCGRCLQAIDWSEVE